MNNFKIGDIVFFKNELNFSELAIVNKLLPNDEIEYTILWNTQHPTYENMTYVFNSSYAKYCTKIKNANIFKLL